MRNENNIIHKDGNYMFNIALMRNATSLESAGCYSDVMGSASEGAQQWATHTIDDIAETENSQYFGWIVSAGESEAKVYIKKSIYAFILKLNDWKHAKNTLVKHLQVA